MPQEVYSAKLSLSKKAWNKALKSAGSATAIFKRSVKALGKGVGRIGKGIGRAGKVMGKAFAAGAIGAAVAVGVMVKKFANAGDLMDKMSKRTGLTTEFLSKLKYVADLSGSSILDMEKAVRRMQKSSLDANNGLKTATRTFDRLGISVNDAGGNLKDSEVLFQESIAALSKVESATEKAALAQELFGKSGTAMLPMLTDGTKGMNAMMEEAKKLGIVWSKEGAASAAEFNDSLTRMQGAVGGLFQGIAVKLMPVLTKAINAIGSWITENKEWLAQDISGALSGIVDWTKKTIEAWGGLEGIIGRVRIGFHAVVGVARVVGAAFGTVAAVALKSVSEILIGLGKLVRAGAMAASVLGQMGLSYSLERVASSIGGFGEKAGKLAEGAFEFSAGQFQAAGKNWDQMMDAGADVISAEKATARGGAAQNIVINNNGVGNMSARDAQKISNSLTRAQRQGIVPAVAGG